MRKLAHTFAKIRIRSLLGANFFTLGERTQTFEFVESAPFVPSSLGGDFFSRSEKRIYGKLSSRFSKRHNAHLQKSQKDFLCASLQLDRKTALRMALPWVLSR